MKQHSISLDERSDEALDRAARYLGLSRSEVIRRLALLAEAAVLWGCEQTVTMVKDPDRRRELLEDLDARAGDEEVRGFAEAGCEHFGLVTLGGDWQSAASIAALARAAIERASAKG